MKIQLYNYQQKVIDNSLNGLITNCYYGLLMDMGTGKTICALNLAEQLKQKNLINGLIVIAPNSLIKTSDTWTGSISKFLEMNYWQIIWSGNKTKKSQKELSTLLTTNKIPIFLINVEAFQATKIQELKVFIQEFIKLNNPLIIIDESTTIKNHKANRTKNILSIFEKAKYKMILTGTPITNTLLDLYTQFEFLKAGFWGYKNYFIFRNEFAIMVDIQLSQGRSFKKVVGFKQIEKLQEKIKTCSIVLKKSECLDLPEKIYENILIELTPSQERIYQEFKKNMIAEFRGKILTVQNKISLFTRFRQIVGGFFPDENKSQLIDEQNNKLKFIIDDSDGYNGKIIIWCAFTNEIFYIVKELNKIVGNYAVDFCGESIDRKENLEKFINDENVKYFVANPSVGGYGLNLQFSSLTYWYSRTLSPEQNWQAEDRQHRLGQKNNVVYKSLIAKNTVDEKIIKALELKTDLSSKFISGEIEDFFNLI